MRVNGNLITMDYPRMLPADTLEVLVNIMTEVQRERFEERGEYDMSFSIPNCCLLYTSVSAPLPCFPADVPDKLPDSFRSETAHYR